MRTVSTKQGDVQVVNIPGKGDCMFLAIAHQLHGEFEVTSPALQAKCLELRRVVATYMRENLQTLFPVLQTEAAYWKSSGDGIELDEEFQNLRAADFPDFNGTLEELKVEIKKIIKYCKTLEESGKIWGSHLCLQAISDVMDLDITIHIENGLPTEIKPSTGKGSRAVNICHRRFSAVTAEPDHFDSVAVNTTPGRTL